ncbi:universal stress protein (plasmid) [Sphingobium baderi]|uniref:universal stress protein n=1 Tax=Sphingobium baderi TaxID=1332080 RepID=UPI002B418353|nr:universal stress protein [Sphingobium baderi]WRD78772.1 universal stress protein [Sphingobium baderi]
MGRQPRRRKSAGRCAAARAAGRGGFDCGDHRREGFDAGSSPEDAILNLEHHGINAEAVDIPLDGRDAAASLQSYCERDGRDLLVMGAFGHSRAREFLLGGVTRSILDGPRLPVFISH